MNNLKTFNYFNSVANKWLAELEGRSEAEILISPAEGQWSLSQLYDHVMKVARKYQIPNFKQSLSDEAQRKERKNLKGFAIFNVGIKRVNVKIKMENFPAPLVNDFTPVKQNKLDLIQDFKTFIEEVNALKDILLNSKKESKHHHPMFGDISAKEWFALIAIHMVHHEKQKKRISDFLATR